MEIQPTQQHIEIIADEYVAANDDDLTADQIQQISTALTNQPDQITGITNQTANMIS
ncbi:hypothetical protein ACJMK2_002802, partial [Sinanodonta woodiana]